MYTVTKRMEVSGAHALRLPYESKCTRLHGHNWIIEVTCRREELDENGMVVDFHHIKDVVKKARPSEPQCHPVHESDGGKHCQVDP